MLDVTAEGNGALLPVKVVPGASRARYVGEWDGRARLTVTAPAEKGRANKAVVDLIAGLLRVSRRDVSVVTGHTSAQKTIRIDRVTPAQVRMMLQSERS